MDGSVMKNASSLIITTMTTRIVRYKQEQISTRAGNENDDENVDGVITTVLFVGGWGEN